MAEGVGDSDLGQGAVILLGVVIVAAGLVALGIGAESGLVADVIAAVPEYRAVLPCARPTCFNIQ